MIAKEIAKFPLPTQPFIDGQYVQAKGSERLTLTSAVNDSILTKDLQVSSAEDVDAAVASAKKGLKAWQALTLVARRQIMLRFADLIVEHKEHLGYLETVLNGKEFKFSGHHEPSKAASLFQYYAGFVDKLDGDSAPAENGWLKIIRHEPYGICAAINSYNSPMIVFAMKAAPALAAGNVMVSKAPELNPFSSLYLGELAIQAGFPPGALNVIIGTVECGQRLASHPDIRKISFTGSVAVGKKIQAAATASNVKSVTLELGGKSPVLVFPDADIELAVNESYGFLRLNGQGCVLGTRIYVHEKVADEFLEKMKKKLQNHRNNLQADPWSEDTISSPLYHHRQKESVLDFLAKASKQSEPLVGGQQVGDKGCYIEPTIYFKPAADSKIVNEEVFGPVAVIDTFNDEAEVLEKANNVEFGLGATIFTQDLDTALRVSDKLEAGTITINNTNYVDSNMSFGGWKSSGVGRENGKYGLLEYTQTKSILIRYKSLGFNR